jgi:hypothetical protein
MQYGGLNVCHDTGLPSAEYEAIRDTASKPYTDIPFAAI